MKNITRRNFLSLSAITPFSLPLFSTAFSKEHPEENGISYTMTVEILDAVYRSEMIAHHHYVGYSQKILEENYPNIAYLFSAFSMSEKIHADNYKRILLNMNMQLSRLSKEINVRDTKSNLRTAAQKEHEKISKTYPEFLKNLAHESHDEAIINCMWSWKYHRQHEEMIDDIRKYSGIFFNSLAREIEGMNFDFYVCQVCGSTVDEKPEFPCEICNHPTINYTHRPIPS